MNDKLVQEELLRVKKLTVHYITKDIGICKAVNDVSFDIRKGETLGIVGETGAGKTTVALSILSLLQSPPGKIMGGEVIYNGADILKMNDHELRMVRGNQISMIFQDPMTALNPIDRIGDQIAEVILLHEKVNRAEAAAKAAEMLEVVGISRDRYKEYPHQFSGGMKQRVVIAMALACSPHLLIADEPTTALDVTIQAQVLDMINALKRENGTSVMLITHDLGVVAQMCDRVVIMYAGEIVEMGDRRNIYKETGHPYTKGLFGSLPSMSSKERRLKPIQGLMPDPANLPAGCKFADRCPYKTAECVKTHPDLEQISPGHWVRCLHCLQGEEKAYE